LTGSCIRKEFRIGNTGLPRHVKGSICREPPNPPGDWLRTDVAAKAQVYALVANPEEIRSLSYWLEITFSAGIAAFGLLLSSPAVIIGALHDNG
jgi:hypothetical protein